MKTEWVVKAIAVASVLGGGSGCVIPRSVGVMQSAAPVGEDGVEVTLGTGMMIQTSSTSTGPTSSISSAAVALPASEGNLQLGFAERLGLNFHVSQAGIQPGLKWSLGAGETNLALLPEFGLLYGASRRPGSSYRVFDWMLGLKVLLSHEVGIYGALGFDYQSLSVSTNRAETDAMVSSPNITAGLGYRIIAGPLDVRPEFALLVIPTMFFNGRGANTGEVTYYPNVSFGLAHPR